MDFFNDLLRQNSEVADSCFPYLHQSWHEIEFQIRDEGDSKDAETNSKADHIFPVLLLQLLSVLVDADSVLFELVDELLPHVNVDE